MWRAASLCLLIISIVANLEWVNLPFSFYGMRGRSGVLYGEYTLLQTFHFHLTGVIWWTIIGLQVFATVIAASNVTGLKSGIRMAIFAAPAIGLLLLNLYIMQRWNTITFWSMFVVGLVPILLLVVSWMCYAKSVHS